MGPLTRYFDTLIDYAYKHDSVEIDFIYRVLSCNTFLFFKWGAFTQTFLAPIVKGFENCITLKELIQSCVGKSFLCFMQELGTNLRSLSVQYEFDKNHIHEVGYKPNNNVLDLNMGNLNKRINSVNNIIKLLELITERDNFIETKYTNTSDLLKNTLDGTFLKEKQIKPFIS